MRVLFMCTANSCRSILSEALFNHLAPQGFQSGKFWELSQRTSVAAQSDHVATGRNLN
jgi:protein-tyrosine-phosphatase